MNAITDTNGSTSRADARYPSQGGSMNAITDTNGSTSLVNFIQRASLDPNIDVSKLEALLRMQREVVAEQAKREFNMAMAAAQSEMQPVVRDAANEHTKSRYARLETIDRVMRPIYTTHGFSVRYGSGIPPKEGLMRILCTVAHAGGHYEEHHLDAPLDISGSQGRSNKTGIQAVGSSVTYLRRYLLTMVFNIMLADEDDDGEAAHGRTEPRKPTVAEWLGALEAQVAIADRAELDRILSREDVVKAQNGLRNGALDRLNAIFKEALDRLATPAEEAKAAHDALLEDDVVPF